MNRREFLQLCGGTLLLSQLPKGALAGVKSLVEEEFNLNIRPITIAVGATKPFSALHISDSHITRTYDNEGERKIALAERRAKYFKWSEHYFDAAIRYAREHDIMILHTGDLIDFVSEHNVDFVREQLGVGEWFASAGNHEYSQFVGEAREDAAYKAQTYDKVQSAYPNDLTLASHVVNGVNFVAVDDVYYNFTSAQQAAMEREVKRGLPIVMLCHVPLYTPEHCKYGLESTKGLCAYLTGVPESITSTYRKTKVKPGEEWRQRSVQQHADKPTLEFVEWLKAQKELKAILCGHCHYFFQERFSPTAIQYTVGAGYKGDAHLVNFV